MTPSGMETYESSKSFKNSRLLDDLKIKLEIVNSMDLPFASSCIYRVPPKLRTINEQAYTPTLISIGPFHCRDKRLGSMQEFKFWFFNQFLKRSNPEKTLQVYFEAVRSLEDEIRRCYSEAIQMESNEFVSMILIDACFIIEFFRADTKLLKDLSTAKPEIESNIMLDLILLENQLPFFVLERLFQLCSPNSNDSFLQISFNSFQSSFLKNIYPSKQQYCIKRRLDWGQNIQQVQHLCDLLRIFYVLDKEQRDLDTEKKRSYGVSQLKDAGIEFQADDARSIIEVQCFDGRRLEMPSIKITSWTEIMLRNVVAFEQCHYPFKQYLTDYIFLLDCLINTEKDIEILVEKKIIENLCDNDKVVAFVNKLCDNVTVRSTRPHYNNNVYKMLDKFYNNTYYKNKATFVRDYWSTPWKKLSLLGGIMLLSLTLIQAICSVVPLFRKK